MHNTSCCGGTVFIIKCLYVNDTYVTVYVATYVHSHAVNSKHIAINLLKSDLRKY